MIPTGKITVAGQIGVGTAFEVTEQVADSLSVDGLRYRQTLQRVFTPTGEDLEFSGEGLTQGYIVFGQPGAGKTHFIRHILRQLLSLNADDAQRRYGGLVIDPKGDYPLFLDETVRNTPARKGTSSIVIYPGMRKAINILHCGLSAESVARIISASVSALAKGADPYFHNNLSLVISSILTAEEIVRRKEPRKAVSMRYLVEIVTGFVGAGANRKPGVQNFIDDVEFLLGDKSGIEWDQREKSDLRRCIDNLAAFQKEEKGYVAAQIFKQAFEALAKLDFLNAPTKVDAPNMYDDIINNARVVLVSIPPGETYARSVFTLMKNIFQKVMLDRYARYAEEAGAGRITNRHRPVFLICDEYHLSASDAPESGVGDTTFLSLARAFGCFSLFATQGLDQIKNSAIGERWEAIIGLFRAKFFFTIGDIGTATLASDLAGEEQSLFVGSSSNEGKDGKSWGASDQLTTKQHLPKYVVLRQLPRGHAAVVGTLDGQSAPRVNVARIPHGP